MFSTDFRSAFCSEFFYYLTFVEMLYDIQDLFLIDLMDLKQESKRQVHPIFGSTTVGRIYDRNLL